MTQNDLKTEKKLIARYGRVSTSNQEDQRTIQNQLMELGSLADEMFGKDGYIVVHDYLDEGWSGDVLARPALDQLRSDAREGLWDYVLIYDPDRLARRYSYQELVFDELKEAHIEVIFKTRPAPKDPTEKILYGVHGLFAEYERAKIAERFRLGKIRKAKNGHVIMSDAPLGYRLVPRRGKPGDPDFMDTHLEVNEEEAVNVRSIFSWVGDEGLTLRKVVKRLYERGIPPRKNKQKLWKTTTLSSMLRNTTYIGEAIYGATYAVVPEHPLNREKFKRVQKTSRRNKPESEWIRIGGLPAIVDKELFYRVQGQLKRNAETSSRNKKNSYLFANIFRCTCGCTRAGEGPQRGKYLYYRCTSRVRSYPLPPSCVEKGINARIADDMVWEKIVELMSSPGLMLEQAKRWMEERQSRVASVHGDASMIEAEIAKLRKQEDRYAKGYAAEVFTLEQFKEHVAPLRERIATLENQIVTINAKQSDTKISGIPSPYDIEKFAQRATEVLKDLKFDEKRVIVLNTVERVVGKPGELNVYGYIPLTNHVELRNLHRYRRSSQRW